MAFTNAGGKFYICVTPKPDDLTQEQFEALTWVEVGNVGALPESGVSSNIVSYDTIDTDVTQKNKGVSDAGSGSLEVARKDTDAGQIALRAAALTKFYYATKRELSDAPSDDYTNTIYYNRGLVVGPTHAGGRNEDFILETFQFGNVQREIVQGPEALTVPSNTVKPAISGAAVQVGVELTAFEGEWTFQPTSYTYQWQHDTSGNLTFANVAAGGTGRTYTPVVGDVGDSLRVQVTAHNGAGSSSVANSVATTPIIAA